MRKYTLNECYFDAIESPEQAYWLGFITADGNIYHPDGHGYSLRITLKASDADHLRLMADNLSSNMPVRTTLRPGGEEARISFHSRHLVNSLENLGVTQRKSLTVRPWDGPPELMPHYWRGLFDGDGCISSRSDFDWIVKICGSKACVDGFADWAREISGSRAVSLRVRENSECWQWSSGGGKKPQAIVAALYKNATVALKRKNNLAMQLCSIDFAARWAESNKCRAQAMREAWSSGKHARATGRR